MSYVESVGIPGLFGLTGAKTAYKDENILLGEAQAINFTGAGVAATLNAGVLTVEIEGDGSSINVVDNLLSTSATDALSANQGNALDSRLQAVENAQADYGDIVTYNASAFDAAGSAATAESNAKNYADGLVLGLLDDRGNYNPTATSAYPTTSGSGVAGAILKGDLWTISADGSVNGIAVTVGDTIRALVDSPAQTNGNWAVIQNNLIYVPENTTNKATSLSLPNDTKYPTTLAVSNAIAASLDPTINTQSGTAYTLGTVSTDNDGKTYLRMTSASANTVTIPSTQTKPISISQRGAGITTLVAGAGVTLNGILTFDAQHQTKTVIPLGGNIFDVVG